LGFFEAFLGSKIPPKMGVYRIWADSCGNLSGFWAWALSQETVPKFIELKIQSFDLAHYSTLNGGVLNIYEQFSKKIF